jgi:hypothetical protein
MVNSCGAAHGGIFSGGPDYFVVRAREGYIPRAQEAIFSTVISRVLLLCDGRFQFTGLGQLFCGSFPSAQP